MKQGALFILYYYQSCGSTSFSLWLVSQIMASQMMYLDFIYCEVIELFIIPKAHST